MIRVSPRARLGRGAKVVALAALVALPVESQGALVLQSDFGARDGAVAAMKGVAVGVSSSLRIHDLTHEIAPFDTWEAAYRLRQVVPFWPPGTVFVSIVDPGVGTERRSVVARTRRGHLLVTPDNGTLTLVADEVTEVRVIDPSRHRLPGSERSHTFHGRDLFAYLGARLAAGLVSFAEVGPLLGGGVNRLPVRAPTTSDRVVTGMVTMIDRPFGNVWTNIPAALLDSARFTLGDTLRVVIAHEGAEVYAGEVPFVASFGNVPVGSAVAYLNSQLEFALALNQGNLAARYGVAVGHAWSVTVTARPRGR